MKFWLLFAESNIYFDYTQVMVKIFENALPRYLPITKHS